MVTTVNRIIEVMYLFSDFRVISAKTLLTDKIIRIKIMPPNQ